MPRAIDDVQLMAAAVTGRHTSIFAEALQAQDAVLRGRFAGKTLLITGGAGFIATQTLKEVLPFQPSVVIIADSDENRLAELVRTVRSDRVVPAGTRIEPRLVDVTTPMVDRLFAEFPGIDACLHFAAAKHVRTERDVVSLLRLLQVNLLGTINVARGLLRTSPDADLFVVSTDKAADPASFMGASKRLMEMATFAQAPQATTTRFANVAFSTGSLLESWLFRLRLGQPLAVPADTWRFFVSPQEAGQLCTLACSAPAGRVVVPDEDATGLVELESALKHVLDAEGLHPVVIDEATLDDITLSADEVPVIVTPRDTAGEKRAEKFVAAGEVREAWLPNVGLLRPGGQVEAAQGFADWLESVVREPGIAVTLQEIQNHVAAALPEFGHVAGSQRLDDRI